MTDDTGVIICPGVVPVLVGPLQVLIPILWGLLLAALGAILALFKLSTLKNLGKLLWRQKLAVCLLGIAVGGLVYGLTTLASANRAGTTDAESGKDWTTARGSLHRTGAVPGAASPNVKKLIWAFKDGNEGFLSSPAVVGNRVYIASVALGAFSQSGKIYCLDADTGGVVWTSAPDNYRPTFSSPVVSGNYLVCGEGLHLTRDARVICLDISPEAKGKVLWTHATNNHVECTPTIADDKVFFGAGDDGVYCLDLKPGPDGKAKVNWHVPNTFYYGADGKQIKEGLKDERFVVDAFVVFKAESKDGKQITVRLRPLTAEEDVDMVRESAKDLKSGQIKKIDRTAGTLTVITPAGDDLVLTMSEFSDCETSLAVQGNFVYMGLGNDGKALCVFEAATGKLVKKLEMPYPVFSPPAIADGKIYLGMGEGDYVVSGEGGAVRCVDLKTFTTDWTYAVPKTVLGAVAVKGDRLYFGCDDGHLYCLSRKGQLINKFDARSPIKTSPAVTDQAVYVVSDTGRLFALKQKTLQLMWDFPLGAQPLFISSPTAARGHIYVGTQSDGFLCVGESDGSLQEGKEGAEKTIVPLWTNPLGGPGRTGNDDESAFPPEVAKLWSFSPIEGGKDKKVAVLTSVACWGDDLYVPFTVKKENGWESGLACISRKSPADATPKPRWVHTVPGLDSGSPVVLMDRVIGVTLGAIYCLDRATGKLLWEKKNSAFYGFSTFSPLTATSSHILVSEKSSALTCLDRDGKQIWSAEIGTVWTAPAFSDSMIVAATKDDLVALDADTGQVLWQTPIQRVVTSPVLAGNIVYVGTETGLEAYSLIDGKSLVNWMCLGGPVTADFALRNKDLIYVNKAGEVIVADCDTGNVKTRIKGARPGYAPLVSRGQVVVVTNKGLAIANTDAEKPQLEPWFDLDKGVISDHGGLVLSDSRVFLPTQNLGLVCIGREK